MDKSTLIAKRDAIQRDFDKQTKMRAQAESEQLRLQGEFRLVNELIDTIPDEEITNESEQA